MRGDMKSYSISHVMNAISARLLSALLVIVAGSPAHAANLLANEAFDHVGANGASTTITTQIPGGAGNSAAKGWTLFTNTAGTIATKLLPSTLVQGKRMIHVVTDGERNGLVQVFGKVDSGPHSVVACAWIKVVKGSVAIGTGNGGNTAYDMVLRKTGSWEVVEVSNGLSPANEFVIYAASPGGGEFYVESAYIDMKRAKCRCPPR